MDTPIINGYYRESDPLNRLALLKKSMAAGEEPEDNEIRMELLKLRYPTIFDKKKDFIPDAYMALWMALEFNKNPEKGLGRVKGAQKEIRKHLAKLKFPEFTSKSELHKELLYSECYHLVNLYMTLCEQDRNYNNLFLGLVPMSEARSKEKLQKDIIDTAILLPKKIEMEEELELITLAARAAYEERFPAADPLPF